jgi:hypothetical protein
VNRSILLVVLGLMVSALAQAEEPSVCASVCASEKQQCTARAAKLTELDDRPSVEEANPLMRAGSGGQIISEPARAAQRDAAQKRGRERVGACNASYKRCSSACAPAVVPVVEQASAGK